MEHLKSIAISICAVALLFGMMKNILPGGRYEKYMRMILTLIFVILTVNAIRQVVFDQEFNLEEIKVVESHSKLQDQLCLQIKKYINEQLKKHAYEAECFEVEIQKQGENYYIKKIFLSADSEEAIVFLREITGLQEEQIYVVS